MAKWPLWQELRLPSWSEVFLEFVRIFLYKIFLWKSENLLNQSQSWHQINSKRDDENLRLQKTNSNWINLPRLMGENRDPFDGLLLWNYIPMRTQFRDCAKSTRCKNVLAPSLSLIAHHYLLLTQGAIFILLNANSGKIDPYPTLALVTQF